MTFSCSRLTPAIGAVVTLPGKLDEISEEFADAVHAALLEHSVLVFPALNLEPTRMVELGAALGTLGMRHHSYPTQPDSEVSSCSPGKGTPNPTPRSGTRT